jgi:hypothetical protein
MAASYHEATGRHKPEFKEGRLSRQWGAGTIARQPRVSAIARTSDSAEMAERQMQWTQILTSGRGVRRFVHLSA